MFKHSPSTPFLIPIASFALAILVGTVLLWSDFCATKNPPELVDALFIATSAVCVTGLATVDISATFNGFGQFVILVLIQLGGLGVATYSTLLIYLWGKRTSLNDRISVGYTLLRDPSFNLGKFLTRIAVIIGLFELCGALAIYLHEPDDIGLFHAIFLSISAFCNAGFTLWPDSLMGWQQDILLNSVIMFLIIFGGLGFAVLDECFYLLKVYGRYWRQKWLHHFFSHDLSSPDPLSHDLLSHDTPPANLPGLSLHSRVVLGTSLALIILGTFFILLPEYYANAENTAPMSELFLPSLFQSVTSRTAGFNSINMADLTDISLLFIIFLMFIGGSPGSCAGGIKTTTFRAMLSFMKSQIQGRQQVILHNRALDPIAINKMFTLLTISTLAITFAVFIMMFTEGGVAPHGKTDFQFLDILFEVVSAFGTVGLSTDVSPHLSTAGKLVDCALMFIGRLGPIWLVTTLQQFSREQQYRLPKVNLPIG